METTNLLSLPEDCIAAVLSFTSPQDSCRISTVSMAMRSASDSDAVWENFLPPELRQLMDQSTLGLSKKKQFLCLCESFLLIENGRMSISLDKRSSKKCYMLSARELKITWSDTPAYWKWTSIPNTRFDEVVELVSVCWLEIRGRVSTSMLSKETLYGAYLVYKVQPAYGFVNQPVEVSFGYENGKLDERTVFLVPAKERRRVYHIQTRRHGLVYNRNPVLGNQSSREGDDDKNIKPVRVREDGWLEVELGECFVKAGVEGELEMNVLEIQGGNWKSGLVIMGIEIRPKPV